MTKTKKLFRSRISVLLTGFLLAIFLPVCIGFLKNGVYDGFYFMSAVLLFCVFFVFRGIHYLISENMLYVKIWFIPVENVDITHIESVERSCNPVAACASSLKRLHLRLKGRSSFSLLISPVREEEFISELKTVNPAIEVSVPDRKGIWRFWDWDM
jgi:hypothetical protein